MKLDNQQHGDHTWDLVQHYYLCPHCEYIFEDRSKYKKMLKTAIKTLKCPRCADEFVVQKKKRSYFPLLGYDEDSAD